MFSFCLKFAGSFLLLFFIMNIGSRAQEIPYSTGNWDADSLGNHRVVVQVMKKTDATRVHIPWRRRDLQPENKNVIVVDAGTGRKVRNVYRVEINREYGDLIFQPHTAPGKYYVYYMPYIMSGRKNYPTVTYQKPENTADPIWLQRKYLIDGKFSQKIWANLPEAKVTAMEAIDSFNSFYPMEVIATKDEVNRLLTQHPDDKYLLFPEDRKYPIRMSDDLPYRWIKKGPSLSFSGEAEKGEFYAFQIGLFACRTAIENITVHFSELKTGTVGTVLPATAFSSFNTEGINWDGKPFKKKCALGRGKVQALWLGVQVPVDAVSGEYTGTVTIAPKGMNAKSLQMKLKIKDKILADGGDSEIWRHSRLRWLNSRIAFDDDIVAPFTPMTVRGKTVSCLGRDVTIGKTGLPQSIVSFFSPGVTHLLQKGREVLQAPIRLIAKLSDGSKVNWVSGKIRFVKKNQGAVEWRVNSNGGGMHLACSARMEFDGYVHFKMKITALKQVVLKDIWLELPLKKEAAKYMMGLGRKGGFCPPELRWKWDVKKHQEGAWLGDVNAGLQFVLRDEKYSRPLNTNFYQKKPLIMPTSWFNDGKGGCDIFSPNPGQTLVKAYSGARTMQAGDSLYFNVNFLLTPFKPLDTKSHWHNRYYHSFKPVAEIVKTGANVINVHHANDVNPYINYPFLHTQQMKTYIDAAHARGMKVKIYNTIRELSNHAVEIFALRSLGNEIFSDGPGGGFSWLQEHLGSHYIAAWFVPKLKDAAIINSGMSRWHNYYLEGLNWLAKNMQIDGIYIDDVAFDRTTMKRLRKILDRNRPGALIDLHSANQYNPRDGFTNSANLYMEHFPYLNRLWFGEYFDYDSAPDFWLVEVSGIPFGLMGEMLQNGGNRWRGMIYGMTARLPWAGDPTPVWKLWDDFGIENSEMIGYWSQNCPVKTDRDDILATVYVRKRKTLISLASWAKTDVTCRLTIDWQALGLNPRTVKITAPVIRDFQQAASFSESDEIPVPAGKGWLLIVKE